MESMYVSMDSANLETPLDPDSPDFIDSFEAYAASERDNSVHKVTIYYKLYYNYHVCKLDTYSYQSLQLRMYNYYTAYTQIFTSLVS